MLQKLILSALVLDERHSDKTLGDAAPPQGIFTPLSWQTVSVSVLAEDLVQAH